MLNRDDRKVKDFLEAWHENYMATTLKDMPELEPRYLKHAEEGSKYLRFDNGDSGHFMCDRTTEQVYKTKGYGVVNLKKPHGTIEQVTANLKLATAKGIDYTRTWWYLVPPVPFW